MALQDELSAVEAGLAVVLHGEHFQQCVGRRHEFLIHLDRAIGQEGAVVVLVEHRLEFFVDELERGCGDLGAAAVHRAELAIVVARDRVGRPGQGADALLLGASAFLGGREQLFDLDVGLDHPKLVGSFHRVLRVGGRRLAVGLAAQGELRRRFARDRGARAGSVSYTYLTLPTSDLV